MKVRLETRDGGFVADEEIPPFAVLPDAVYWGERFFVAKTAVMALSGDAPVYREGMVFCITDPRACSGALG